MYGVILNTVFDAEILKRVRSYSVDSHNYFESRLVQDQTKPSPFSGR
jgi:hypothetical protein